ncbi:MAG: protein kinase domain-containing protein [Planctomycetota bacterium]|jgi:tRNA A-37 threonylcarbamoyl transferase component Bud32
MARLRIAINGESSELELRNNIKAGRNPDNDLPLEVKEASRVHLMVGRIKDGGWALRDLGSTNGTFLNGERVEKTVKLKHEDEISVGPDCTLTFWDAEPAEAPAPEPPVRKAKKKPSGPIVLKSRAQKMKDKQDEERAKRAAERKAKRTAKNGEDKGAAEQAAEQEAVAQEEAEKTAAVAPPPPQEEDVDAIQIESEVMLDKLIKDKEAADKLLAGDKQVHFGPYTVKQRLSEGGMGYVVKARHRKLRQDVALKLLRTERVDENNIARFKQEAWAISAFDHPNIVKVRDLGEHAGMHYIAMDFIDGEDLLAVGFKGTMTFWQVMEAIDKLADVLRLVHARNIWHRDLKPQNVLLDLKGEIKLIDFGIATVEREQDDATQTAEGLIMGTPAFLSPEQAARGKMGEIDGRADLYSLGAVLYYLLTGRRPFTGKSAIEILKNNMTKPPPHPHTVDKMIPPGLVDICLKLLEKHPDDRFQSAAELQASLGQWRKSKDGRVELERHKKIMKMRALKAKKR